MLFAGVYESTFQPGNFTGRGSEGVKMFFNLGLQLTEHWVLWALSCDFALSQLMNCQEWLSSLSI